MSLSSVVFALSAFVLLPANRKTHKNILPITINNSTGQAEQAEASGVAVRA